MCVERAKVSLSHYLPEVKVDEYFKSDIVVHKVG